MQSSKRRDNYSSVHSVDKFILPLLEREIICSLKEMVPHEHLSNQNLFLDVGCGNQPFRTNIEELGFTYRSLDIQQNVNKNVDFILAIDSPFDRPELLHEFNVILFSEVAEHVFDVKQAFLNLSKLLKAGGSLILTTPFVYGLHEEPNDYWRLTNYAIERFAKESGFEIVHAKKLGDGWDVLGTILGLNSIVPASNSFLSKMLAYFALKLRNLLWKCLSSDKFRSSVKFSETNNSIYLSNFYVLRKV